jgi:diguanylate cyclase (GGDEF)-like protein
MAVPGKSRPALGRLGTEIRGAAWELSLEVVRAGLEGDAIPSMARLAPDAQLADVPAFLGELAGALEHLDRKIAGPGSLVAALAREHARSREAVGFAPREVVTEFLFLRQVLWRFISTRVAALETEDVLEIEQRLNDTIDRLVTECVVAYFDRATLELALQARRDPLTGLLNHQAFSQELEIEIARAQRYGHGLTLVFLDLDAFKLVNDTLGHLEGDLVLRSVARGLESSLRGSDSAGRIGGDEFAVLLLESEQGAVASFLERLDAETSALGADLDLPADFGFSAGMAHYPSEVEDADTLFRLADSRLYDAKRAKHR